MVLIVITSIAALIAIAVFWFLNYAPQIGSNASGDRLVSMQASPHYKAGKFENPVPTSLDIPPTTMAKVFWEMQVKGSKNEPQRPIKNSKFDPQKFLATGPETTLSWFGHSSLLLKISGKTLLIDPVFSQRASMVSFAGPKRFPYAHHITVDQLPPIDAVILSHDHYDHLDYETIIQLKEKIHRFYTPLGVGAHLEKWGIPGIEITELDWWESIRVDDQITLTATPNRHFSGRGFSRNKTLWCSYVISGQHNIFYGADSGYYPGFKKIGERYGPFDLTLLECGAYNELWKEIHMLPEQTALAHLDLQGKILLPIHWGKFNLALHPWKEPMERLEKKAKSLSIQMLTPKPNDIVVLGQPLHKEKWWKEHPG